MFDLLTRSGKPTTIKFSVEELFEIDAIHEKAVTSGYMKPEDPFYCLLAQKEVMFYFVPFYMAGGMARDPETGDIQDPWNSLVR